MSEPFTFEALAAGDVLLYRAEDGIKNLHSALIRKLDGTEVSHAGLFIGDGTVAEALAVGEHAGLDRQPVEDSVAGSKWVAVRRLKQLPGPMTPVLEVANSYLAQHNRYAYGQIVLLAGICLTRKLDLDNWLLRCIARTIFDQSTALLERFRKEGKEPMICSEFVFRTYDEARPEPDDPYSLEILSQAAAAPRRWFSQLRRQRQVARDKTPSKVPTIHPDSVLAQLEAAGETPERLLAAAENKVTAVARPEEDLDPLIEQYLAETEVIKSDRPPAVAAAGPVSMDELLDAARHFAAELADAAARKAETANRRVGVAKGLAEAAPKTLADIVADFVTPGDLLKSPSLTEAGTICP
ncbi:MAG: C40 family peptidase [Pirellulaceae bacterium]|jgi:hypothetical protein